MSASKLPVICLCALTLALSGCVARTYNLTRDRVDQDLTSISGNRGYLTGQPSTDLGERRTTRTTRVIEVELGFQKQSTAKCPSTTPLTTLTEEPATTYQEPAFEETNQTFEKYTVGKNDTLQKISRKFYGTTKKWMKIYEANRDVLSTPDKLYPGQTLNIPAGKKISAEPTTVTETKENLK